LLRAANFYLQSRRSNAPCRFDIVAITQANGKRALEWIQNAFQAI
jgi:Holliday junction resolvase-like predicted endonuclease